MRKTTIATLLFALWCSTFTYAQRFNMITEGVISNDALSTLAYYKNDLDKLELKGKVKTLTIKGTFDEWILNFIYKFNPEGKLTLITNPEGTETHTYTYDSQGHLKSCVTLRKNVEYANGKRDNVFKTTFNYSNGRLISHHGPFDSTTKYTYNAQGRLVRMGENESAILFNAQGQVISCTMASPIEYTYDSTGKLIKRISLNYGMDDTDKVTATYTYNVQGDIIKETLLYQTYQDQDGPNISQLKNLTRTTRQQITYSYVYDSKGNWTKLTSSNRINLTRHIEYYPN